MKSILKIGTRGSALAIYQAELTKGKINALFPMVSVDIIKIKTSGDMIRREGLHPFETKRIFTKEIEAALLTGEVDIAVHSAKDLSVDMPSGLALGACLEREDPRDCLVSRDHLKLYELPVGARVGTGSIRRQKQLLKLNPGLIVEEIHGNVDTRIRKLKEGNYDALCLAHAGLIRLGYHEVVSDLFPKESFLPAGGQGIIVVQIRQDDEETRKLVKEIHHEPSALELAIERDFLKTLNGGCQLPCGIATTVTATQIKLQGALFDVETTQEASAIYECSVSEWRTAGHMIAEKILKNGGQNILDGIRKKFPKKNEK